MTTEIIQSAFDHLVRSFKDVEIFSSLMPEHRPGETVHTEEDIDDIWIAARMTSVALFEIFNYIPRFRRCGLYEIILIWSGHITDCRHLVAHIALNKRYRDIKLTGCHFDEEYHIVVSDPYGDAVTKVQYNAPMQSLTEQFERYPSTKDIYKTLSGNLLGTVKSLRWISKDQPETATFHPIEDFHISANKI